MARKSARMRLVEGFDERQFYLEEFRGHTLVLAVAARDLHDAACERELAALARTLITNSTQLILLIEVDSHDDVAAVRQTTRRRLRRSILQGDALPLFGNTAQRQSFALLEATAFDTHAATTTLLSRVWSVLRAGPMFVGFMVAERHSAAVAFAAKLAVALRVQKLVVAQAAGGLVGADGNPISFMDEAMLEALLTTSGEAEFAGLASRRETLRFLREALLGGVGSANLCRLDEAARELFTYEGSGTLFTLEDYCRVERLGVDDFHEAERLVERGQREGVLKPRSPEEIADLLPNSYGATIGAHHLAGICALVRAGYEGDRAAEIVGLYTITRFKGEGVGVRLVERSVADARTSGLAYVFAATTVDRAQSFFERCGFRVVAQDQVPSAKWRGYDPERKKQVIVLRMDL